MAEFKSLKEHNPWYLGQWDYEVNHPQTPETVSWSSGRRVTWTCEKNHSWQISPNQRAVYGTGCPYCSNRRVLAGYNDVATTHPEAMDIWDFSKNTVDPSTVVAGSHKKVFWVRACGHSVPAQVHQVVIRGYGCGVCSGRHGAFPGNSFVDSNPGLKAEWHPDNDKDPETLTRNSGYRAKWICAKGHVFEVSVNDRVNYATGCAKCIGRSESGPEAELSSFIRGLGLNLRRNDRKVLGRLEADIVIPESKVILEFNGLYWHSTKFKTKTYHYEKSLAAEKAGFQLIHIWEDDWRDRRDVVQKMLKRKLGMSTEDRLNARSLTYRQVTSAESGKFLEENHIQGSSGGSWRGGLFNKDELVAVMLMRRRSEGNYELTRFATSAIVRGGHSKLLKRFIEETTPSRIVTFADRGVSDGGLYASCGFKIDGVQRPEYAYVKGGVREHKFNYRKARFKKDPNLKFEEGLTERELATLNGLERIYDAGKVRWVWTP